VGLLPERLVVLFKPVSGWVTTLWKLRLLHGSRIEEIEPLFGILKLCGFWGPAWLLRTCRWLLCFLCVCAWSGSTWQELAQGVLLLLLLL
jgi:hypothetical protein